MTIYIGVAPLHWRWGTSVDQAIERAIDKFDRVMFQEKNQNVPVNLYLFNKEMDDLSRKRWLLSDDCTFLGLYRAFPRSDRWEWTKIHMTN